MDRATRNPVSASTFDILCQRFPRMYPPDEPSKTNKITLVVLEMLKRR